MKHSAIHEKRTDKEPGTHPSAAKGGSSPEGEPYENPSAAPFFLAPLQGSCQGTPCVPYKAAEGFVPPQESYGEPFRSDG